MKATVDFETRSAADLRTTGPYLYACHPSTEILCMAWQYGDGPDVLLWHPAMPGATSGFVGKGKDRRADVVGMPEEGRDELEALFLMIESGEIETIEAHNAMFERVIFMLVGPRYGFPKIDPRVWRCSAAASASFALPRGLDPAARALGLKQQKDTEGHALMLKLSQPAAPTKTQPDRKWRQDVDDLRRLYDYCKQDVRTEHALSTSLRSLPAVELATWQLDQEMNLRGVQVDTAFVQRALDIAETEIAACNLELDIITGGDVSSVSQVKKLLEWLNTQGWVGDSLAGGVIDEALKCELPDHVRRALELRRSASRTSTKKYAAIIASICDDGRLRDLLSYYGANTGRWAGRRVQPQNFPRGTIKAKMDTMVADVMTHDVEVLRMLYSDPMELLASALRGVFVAPPGKHLFVADYAAIEARVTAWTAGQQDLLDLFASGKDVYKVQAGAVFGVPEAQIRPEQRQLGKAAVLGLGFQMGPSKFVTTCAASPYFITIPESCEHIKLEVDCECVTGFKTVRAYRQKNHKIVQLWKDLQDGAIEAITRGPGGNPVVTGKITWAQRGRFLHAKLPSGRLLSYCDPSVEMAHVVGERADGTEYDFLAPSIRFMGLSSLTHKWERQYTYGGSLTENVVQATARDLMRDAMLRLEATEVYKMILTIHDELIAEADIDRGDLREYEKLVSAIEPWAAGMPVKAEGWRGPRYHK